MEWPLLPNRDVSRLSNVKILVALPDGQGCIRSEEFMSRDSKSLSATIWVPSCRDWVFFQSVESPKATNRLSDAEPL